MPPRSPWMVRTLTSDTAEDLFVSFTIELLAAIQSCYLEQQAAKEYPVDGSISPQEPGSPVDKDVLKSTSSITSTTKASHYATDQRTLFRQIRKCLIWEDQAASTSTSTSTSTTTTPTAVGTYRVEMTKDKVCPVEACIAVVRALRNNSKPGKPGSALQYPVSAIRFSGLRLDSEDKETIKFCSELCQLLHVTQTLQTMDFSESQLGNAFVMRLLREGVAYNETIRSLVLRSTNIDSIALAEPLRLILCLDDGTDNVRIASSTTSMHAPNRLPCHRQLRHLDLSQNAWCDIALHRLSLIAMECPRIVSLLLDLSTAEGVTANGKPSNAPNVRNALSRLRDSAFLSSWISQRTSSSTTIQAAPLASGKDLLDAVLERNRVVTDLVEDWIGKAVALSSSSSTSSSSGSKLQIEDPQQQTRSFKTKLNQFRTAVKQKANVTANKVAEMVEQNAPAYKVSSIREAHRLTPTVVDGQGEDPVHTAAHCRVSRCLPAYINTIPKMACRLCTFMWTTARNAGRGLTPRSVSVRRHGWPGTSGGLVGHLRWTRWEVRIMNVNGFS